MELCQGSLFTEFRREHGVNPRQNHSPWPRVQHSTLTFKVKRLTRGTWVLSTGSSNVRCFDVCKLISKQISITRGSLCHFDSLCLSSYYFVSNIFGTNTISSMDQPIAEQYHLWSLLTTWSFKQPLQASGFVQRRPGRGEKTKASKSNTGQFYLTICT